MLPRNAQRGSRPRCFLLTDGPDAVVAGRLTRLAQPFAVVDASRHTWLPRGLASLAEARLGRASTLLPLGMRESLTDWWLAVRRRANTPNWDIASRATVAGREGLLLVEAKAHTGELKDRDALSATNAANGVRMRAAVGSANDALNAIAGAWRLTCDSGYQLANRFAWAWKLASLGVPVVLIYLGFLNAGEMVDQGQPFATADAWERAVRGYSAGVVPEGAWGATIDVGGAPLLP